VLEEFDVPLDHFDASNNATFPLRYIIETKYYKPGGPIFLDNAGEGKLAPWVTGGHLFELANQNSGVAIAMEHRFYGQSIPTKDLSSKSLRYLSSDQALADMAYFIENWAPENITLPEKSSRRWISVGGSYPGNLAAWMRLKYPNLVFAAYSSSAPVRAKYDYFEYDLAVGDALGEDCATSVATAIEYIDAVMDAGDKDANAAVRTKFGLQNVTRNDDFGSALSDFMSYAVQYGDHDVTTKFCKIPKYNATDNESAPKIIDFFGQFQQTYMKENNVSVSDYISSNSSDKLEDNKGSGRQWYWQTCTEFGYWQSAPQAPQRRVRSKYVTAEYYENGCTDAFGKDNIPPRPQVERINTVYQADHINTTRIVFVNGELDPWRRLSVSAPDAAPRQSSPDVPVYIVKGGSHCEDLGRKMPGENPSKTEVNANIDADIKRWLAL